MAGRKRYPDLVKFSVRFLNADMCETQQCSFICDERDLAPVSEDKSVIVQWLVGSESFSPQTLPLQDKVWGSNSSGRPITLAARPMARVCPYTQMFGGQVSVYAQIGQVFEYLRLDGEDIFLRVHQGQKWVGYPLKLS